MVDQPLRERGAIVSAYYLSNVEDYLSRERTWLSFCANAATLPMDAKSTFIRSGGGYRRARGSVPGAQLTMTPAQVGRVVAQGIQAVTLPNGGTVTVKTSSNVVTGMSLANSLGLMQEDLTPCSVLKLSLVR